MRFFKKFQGKGPETNQSNVSQPVVSRRPTGFDTNVSYDTGIVFSTDAPVSRAIVSRPVNSPGKTRLIGFDTRDGYKAHEAEEQPEDSASDMSYMTVGWLLVADGPGRGNSFPLAAGLSTIGRAEDQSVQLDFGDRAISRSNHAAIVYDPGSNEFLLGHGGKANLVRLNGSPVLSTMPIESGDEIQIGETRLLFKALCDDAFKWDETNQEEDSNVAFG